MPITIDFKTIGHDLVELLETNAIEAGKELLGDLEDAKDYAVVRLQHMATIPPTEAGYREALIAERDNIVLKAAGRAIDRGDAFDARLAGIAEGVLNVVSKMAFA